VSIKSGEAQPAANNPQGDTGNTTGNVVQGKPQSYGTENVQRGLKPESYGTRRLVGGMIYGNDVVEKADER
jgi:hypothetical protein